MDLFSSVRLHLATLHRPGLAVRLVNELGSAEAVFRLSERSLARAAQLPLAKARALLGSRVAKRAEEELRHCQREGIECVSWGTEGYPSRLCGLDHMPLLLFVRGRFVPGGSSPSTTARTRPIPALSIVGSRLPTPYGLRQSRRFAGSLAARGVTIVSGLARGVDGAAHEAALDVGGFTLAVLGCGLSRVYPREHEALARRILDGGGGALISEFPCVAPPRSFHFPLRNRLLSGLAEVVLVVEAGARSGSLITVDWALRQGRTVFAVPGRVDDSQAVGGLALLRDGAQVALGPEDILADRSLSHLVAGSATTPAVELPPATHAPVLPGPLGAALRSLFRESDSWSADSIADRLQLSPATCLSELTRLELDGFLRQVPGGRFALR